MAKKLRTLDDVVGHRSLVQYLKKHIESDSIPNVAIFYGEPGTGKSSVAKLVAIEITTRHESKELKEDYIRNVVDNNEATDSIKLFNMSEIQEKEEEIQRVKAAISVAFTRTKRKVLILDEAHNMSKKAQDAILTVLEHLPTGVFVFICTTEMDSLRQALQSRCKAPFRFSNLSDSDARKVADKAITEQGITFDITREMAIAVICNWANNQPRKICNLIENFDQGTLVTSKDLELFVNVTNAATVIELLKYLYGSLTLGIDYVSSLNVDDVFISILIEVCKVALGYTSNKLSQKDNLYIAGFMQERDKKPILQFTTEVAGLGELRKRRIVSAFMRSHISYSGIMEPTNMSSGSAAEDARVISENAVRNVNNLIPRATKSVPTLEEMFANADIIEM